MGVWAPVIFRFSILCLSKHLRFWRVISSGSYSNVYKFSFIWIAIKIVFNWVVKGADFGSQWLQRFLHFAWFRKKMKIPFLAWLQFFSICGNFRKYWEPDLKSAPLKTLLNTISITIHMLVNLYMFEWEAKGIIKQKPRCLLLQRKRRCLIAGAKSTIWFRDWAFRLINNKFLL